MAKQLFTSKITIFQEITANFFHFVLFLKKVHCIESNKMLSVDSVLFNK